MVQNQLINYCVINVVNTWKPANLHLKFRRVYISLVILGLVHCWVYLSQAVDWLRRASGILPRLGAAEFRDDAMGLLENCCHEEFHRNIYFTQYIYIVTYECINKQRNK